MLEEHFKKRKKEGFNRDQTLITYLLPQQDLLLERHQVQNQQGQVIALNHQKAVYLGHNRLKNEREYNKNLVDENTLLALHLLKSKYPNTEQELLLNSKKSQHLQKRKKRRQNRKHVNQKHQLQKQMLLLNQKQNLSPWNRNDEKRNSCGNHPVRHNGTQVKVGYRVVVFRIIW